MDLMKPKKKRPNWKKLPCRHCMWEFHSPDCRKCLECEVHDEKVASLNLDIEEDDPNDGGGWK
jgi:hypothetical protein